MKMSFALACLGLLMLPAAAQSPSSQKPPKQRTPTTYPIKVHWDGSDLTFTHEAEHGYKGNQRAGSDDVIHWTCDGSLRSCTIAIHFTDGDSPCTIVFTPPTGTTNGSASCTISAGRGITDFLDAYKYTIQISANNKIYTKDPKVVVDNGSRLPIAR